MVTTREPEMRARDREHERTNMVSDEGDFEPVRRDDLRPGLLLDERGKLPIELLHSLQASCTRSAENSESK